MASADEILQNVCVSVAETDVLYFSKPWDRVKVEINIKPEE